jgi:hypothetical protein
MRKRKGIVLAMVGLALVGWSSWEALRTREPQYQGKRLSAWLEEYNRAGELAKTGPVSDAIRAMGTNCLPFLLANLKHVQSPLKEEFFEIVQKQHLVKLPFGGVDRYRPASVLALGALGSNAAPLLPELLQMAEAPATTAWGTMAMLAIGPAAIPTLEKVCENTNEFIRTEAALMIAMLKVKPEERMAWGWDKTSTHGKPVVRVGYGIPKGTLLELVSMLQSPEGAIRRASVDALGHYPGTTSQVAELAGQGLRKALDDTNEEVRISATNALKIIDHDRAGQAEVK